MKDIGWLTKMKQQLAAATNVHADLTDHFSRIFQLKVGGAVSEDIERIRAVRNILDQKVGYICLY